jgi:stage VI sporulation protein D
LVEHQGGLRFDIYERVHLSEGVAGIKELEDVELVPHIQVLPQGEQALLRGNLLLSGTYVDEQDAVNRTLEHLIPVEITLPMNRVQRVEDIAVEIENFDVDLLSTRSLNITGVLSLNGIEVISAPANDRWAEAEEEVVFVHEAPPQRAPDSWSPQAAQQEQLQDQSQYPNPFSNQQYPGQQYVNQQYPNQQYPNQYYNPYPGQYQPQNQPQNPYQARPDWPQAAPIEPLYSQPEHAEPAYSGQAHRVELPAEDEVPAVAAEAEITEEEDNGSLVAAVETAEFVNDVPPAAEEKKELKIAFSGKKAADEKPAPSNGLSSLLQSSSAGKFDARAQERQEAEAPAAAAPNPGGKLEWKKLLLSSMSDQQEFRRVRLCIVQKEETLDTIAKRYELNPREIALFNRLGDTDLTEGQIVYIPK